MKGKAVLALTVCVLAACSSFWGFRRCIEFNPSVGQLGGRQASASHMKEPHFDQDGVDQTTFAPFILRNALDTEWADIRLEFSDWGWLNRTYGDTVDDYYLNGYGVEGLIKAVRFANGLDPEPEGIDYNSEGDTCYIHFRSIDECLRTASLSAEMIASIEGLKAAIQIAYESGWADG